MKKKVRTMHFNTEKIMLALLAILQMQTVIIIAAPSFSTTNQVSRSNNVSNFTSSQVSKEIEISSTTSDLNGIRKKRNTVAYSILKPSQTAISGLIEPAIVFVSINLNKMWYGAYNFFGGKINSFSSVNQTEKKDNIVHDKIIPQYRKPTFALRKKILLRKTRDLVRQKRVIPAFVAPAARIVGWTVGMAVAGAAASVAGAVATDQLAERREKEQLKRLKIDCTKNNAGCFESLCWANCGPRLHSSDWCFTAKTIHKDKNKTEIAKCVYASDCDPCWSCGTTCYMDTIIENGIVSSGQIKP